MTELRAGSKFKQKRSTDTKQKMLEAAEKCFCKNGYYGSSIQKMAEVAEVSVGSYYFYFRNKDEILMEVYEIQNKRFLQTVREALSRTALYEKDKRVWLSEFIKRLFVTYSISGKLRAELKVLCYEKPQIAQQRIQIKDEVLSMMTDAIKNSSMQSDLKVKDPETALMLTTDLIDAVYDRIENEKNKEQKVKLEAECLDLLYKYLLL